MSFLDRLTINQKDIVVSLPYRVGHWISQSDQTGGAEASEQELQVLSNIIHGIAEELFGSENVQHIMSETVNKQSEWHKWAERSEDLLDDCTDAMDLVEHYGEPKDAIAFQHHLMEIGEAVALAFSEYQHAGFMDQLSLKLSYFITRFFGGEKTMDEYLSVSRQERLALARLKAALEKRNA